MFSICRKSWWENLLVTPRAITWRSTYICCMSWVTKKFSVVNHSNSTTARAMAHLKLKMMLYRLQLDTLNTERKASWRNSYHQITVIHPTNLPEPQSTKLQKIEATMSTQGDPATSWQHQLIASNLRAQVNSEFANCQNSYDIKPKQSILRLWDLKAKIQSLEIKIRNPSWLLIKFKVTSLFESALQLDIQAVRSLAPLQDCEKQLFVNSSHEICTSVHVFTCTILNPLREESVGIFRFIVM